MYEPLFTISAKAFTDSMDVTRILTDCKQRPKCLNFKMNREMNIRSIHSSLSIEGNMLSVEEVSDVLNGKRVVGRERDILEVRNAWDCYSMLDDLNPYDLNDLLHVHGVLMKGLLKNAGNYRTCDVGVYDGEKAIHMGPPAQFVPGHMMNLFEWLSHTDIHPILASSIFHYEFEFIHPFEDGNGRTGRFWQTLILCKWNDSFKNIPVETVIHRRRDEYYRSIEVSNIKGESGPFIDFMISALRESIMEWRNEDIDIRNMVLEDIADGSFTNAMEESEKAGVSKATMDRLLKKLKDEGRIERVGSNKTGRWVVVDRG